MDLLQQLLDAASKAGGFAGVIFAILWWLERGERRELQTAKDTLFEKTLSALNETKAALGHLRDLLLGGKQ